MKRPLILIPLVTTALFAGTAVAGDADKFRAMDTDGDGRVTSAEHAAGARQMFDSMDANRDGAVTMEEMKAYKDRKHDAKDSMRDGDKHRDGTAPSGNGNDANAQRDGGN